MYRVDIVRNGQRWTDTVGVSATAESIAATAVALVAEAAVETQPAPGLRCVAEVFDDSDRLVLRAELVLTS